MKKIILSFLIFSCLCSFVSAQSVDDAKKLLYYEKMTSAKQELQKLVASDPKNVQAIYWLGQTYIYDKEYDSAKSLYQNAISSGLNDPLLWVGTGHVEILDGGDVNAAKQKFEQAITATTATKGKKKGQPDPDILTAIGRAMASGSSEQGDANYGIDKLKQAAQLDPGNPDIYVNLGLCYQKLGGDHGGEAFEAFRQATVANPQYARAYYRIGRIYQSQRNLESMNEWYGKAINADPTFAPVYAQYFNYYAERDVSVAKEYLDKFVANADKDCATDYFVGDYLFRAGKYQESLQKAQEMEMGACKNYSRLNLLYAYDYDRLGDSVKSKNYIQKYFATAEPEAIQPADYAFGGSVLAKFPETGDSAIHYLQKAIALDTVKEERKEFLTTAAKIAAESKNYGMMLSILHTAESLNNGKLSEIEYYNLSKAITDAKSADTSHTFDSAKYLIADSIIQAYVIAYPDKLQGYSFRTRFAKMADVDSSRGLALKPIDDYNQILLKDTSSDAKARLFDNYTYMLLYYVNYATDVPKEQEYKRAVDLTDKMKGLYPDVNSKQYIYADNIGKQIQGALDKFNKAKGGGTAGKSQK